MKGPSIHTFWLCHTLSLFMTHFIKIFSMTMFSKTCAEAACVGSGFINIARLFETRGVTCGLNSYTECCATLAEEWSWVYSVCARVHEEATFSTICPGNEAGRKKSDNNTHPQMRGEAWTGLCSERSVYVRGSVTVYRRQLPGFETVLQLLHYCSWSIFSPCSFLFIFLFLSIWINMAWSHSYNHNLERKCD